MKSLSPAATALLANGFVEPAVAAVREYHVRASDGVGTYRVFIGAHTAVCTCAAKRGCKHLDAVRAREWATPDELALMDEALEVRRERERAAGEAVMAERPSTTVNCDPRIAEPGRHEPGESGSQYGPETVRVSIAEAAALQSFPADWPWHAAGTKTAAFRTVGNAIPPLLALHVLLAVVGPELAASLQERLAALTNRKDAA